VRAERRVFRRVRKIAKRDYYLRHVRPSVRLSVCPHETTRAPTGRIFMKFDTWGFFEHLSRKFNFDYNLTKLTNTSHEDLCTFMIKSRWMLRIRNISNKSCRENQNTHFTFTNDLRKPHGLWDNVAKYGTARRDTDGLRETWGWGDWREVQNDELHASYTACAAAQCSCPLFWDIAPHHWIIGARRFGTAR
jgi:hypothetical protein